MLPTLGGVLFVWLEVGRIRHFLSLVSLKDARLLRRETRAWIFSEIGAKTSSASRSRAGIVKERSDYPSR